MNQSTADELDGMTSAEHYAYLYAEHGADAVAAMLQILINPSAASPEAQKYLADSYGPDGNVKKLRGTSRESLQRDAAELLGMGLPVGALVEQAAMQARSEREILCPYQPEDRCNWESWQASYNRDHPDD